MKLGGQDLTTKRHEETFSCDKDILHLDFGGGYMTEHLSKFLELYVYLKRRNYTSINLALEIRHHIKHKQYISLVVQYLISKLT